MSNDDSWTFTLDDDIIIDTSNITTNNSMISSHGIDTVTSIGLDTVTIGSASDMTYTISTSDATGYSWADSDDIVIKTHKPVDFTDCLPDFSKIQAMCAEYPGLDKAFDNFKVTYKMVHQDWIGKQKKK